MKRRTAPVTATLMMMGAVVPAGGVDAALRQTTVPGAYQPADPVPFHASPEPHPDPYYHLSSPVSAFTARGEEGIDAYYYMIYSYGARTLNDLRNELGDKQFYQSMQTWFQEQKFGIATTKEFIDTMERTSGKNLDKFFEAHRVYLSDQE
ncbi:hypothetical protein GCM10011571_14860 [Marinithermofilum abyssi]|uniref:Peptidase M1 membrane alanine aminopeptidase domain-containing protein n=1 Tax=Marinithermofilum abyssi TaxID=1571185 RepID=A0A8J2YD35_9BACL|nr:M1 family aminopeptidase [Marinithermofilum abyssi]GGE14421.1 hypothetical protein GCM10011571_14860 [Marinithermofilum abyssi]